MYEIIDISLASTDRFIKYAIEKNDTVKGSGLKAFDHAWVINEHPWSKDEKVLDIGGAYSWLPSLLQERFGCETWVADDFGMGSGEEFWQRKRDPHEHIAAHPELKFVLERVGDITASSLPANYFDVVYSVSTLEHVPGNKLLDVWRHMDHLLKPGGSMMHCIDIPFPSNGGMRRITRCMALDMLRNLLPMSVRYQYFKATPLNYASLVCKALTLPQSVLAKRQLGVPRMVLDPEIVTESYEFAINRVKKDNPKYRYRRVGTLIIHLKKV